MTRLPQHPTSYSCVAQSPDEFAPVAPVRGITHPRAASLSVTSAPHHGEGADAHQNGPQR